ncbi:MAG: isoleucine--tRNA ligase, partial [Alphaproteobacteria bacterium]|nr:isoleucine--tRNA ligase [Alphaproteobacteria bacterium]
GALEIKRRDKVIGSSLEARPVLFVSDADAELLAGVDLAEIAITSGAKISTRQPPADVFALDEIAGVAVSFHHAEGDKCARCWMILPEVGSQAVSADLCARCAAAVEETRKEA